MVEISVTCLRCMNGYELNELEWHPDKHGYDTATCPNCDNQKFNVLNE